MNASQADRYFARQAAKADALTRRCPSCGAADSVRCTDRWGHPTGLVHQARHAGYADPYALTEVN